MALSSIAPFDPRLREVNTVLLPTIAFTTPYDDLPTLPAQRHSRRPTRRTALPLARIRGDATRGRK